MPAVRAVEGGGHGCRHGRPSTGGLGHGLAFGLRLLRSRYLLVERRGGRRLGLRGGGLLLGNHVGLDLAVDAVQRALVLAVQLLGRLLGALQVVAGGVAAVSCCWRAAWVACNWVWAVCRLSMVVVTLPVAMDEYSDRMPEVLGSDENIWVTWLLVPLLV